MVHASRSNPRFDLSIYLHPGMFLTRLERDSAVNPNPHEVGPMESEQGSTIKPGHNGGGAGRALERSAAGGHDKVALPGGTGSPTVDRMTVSAHEAVDRVSGAANRAVETLGTKGKQLNAAEKRLVAGTQKYVREHPVASVGMAITAGYLLSRIFSRR